MDFLGYQFSAVSFRRKIMNIEDIKKQAQWEIDIENFEILVAKEKVRLQEKKVVFPWRIKLINVNKEK